MFMGRVAHRWQHVVQGTEGLSNHGKRTCELCGRTQVKLSTHSWGRVTGYQWYPLSGNCPGEKK